MNAPRLILISSLIFLYLSLKVNASATDNSEHVVTFETLLREMTDRSANTRFPCPAYRAAQVSSYDRRTVAPNMRGWFANNDGRGIVRMEQNNGRTEKVLFDERGPGAVTRIWMTTSDKRGTLRFYFDGADESQLVLPAYDMSSLPIVSGGALVYNHTHYKKEIDKTGGNTCFVPFPFSQALKITLEDGDPDCRIPHYYQIGFRRYENKTRVETFSPEELRRCEALLTDVDAQLLSPSLPQERRDRLYSVSNGSEIILRGHSAAIVGLVIRLSDESRAQYSKVMNETRLQISFDGKCCVNVPLSDFFAGGVDAPAIRCWQTTCDGVGQMESRWVMPFRRRADIRFSAADEIPFNAKLEVLTADFARDERTLYFHALGRSQNEVPVSPEYDSMDIVEWNVATIAGRGIFVGDVLSVNNHLKNWFGEGDEKIWVDDDIFPSTHGTGLEDYYNCSWAPVVKFLTPYGGVPRADEKTSHGRTAWLRTRLLDGIPFERRFCFDFEMEGWSAGTVDLQTAYFWYGDL